MTHIEYFKLQAKNLFRDYKTQTSYIEDGDTYYKYAPKFFDIDGIIVDYDLDEENLSLMKLQHIIALMIGFEKWSDLLKASEAELELAKQLFDNQDKIFLENWEMMYGEYDAESQLEIFKQVVLNGEEHYNPFPDYRLNTMA